MKPEVTTTQRTLIRAWLYGVPCTFLILPIYKCLTVSADVGKWRYLAAFAMLVILAVCIWFGRKQEISEGVNALPDCEAFLKFIVLVAVLIPVMIVGLQGHDPFGGLGLFGILAGAPTSPFFQAKKRDLSIKS